MLEGVGFQIVHVLQECMVVVESWRGNQVFHDALCLLIGRLHPTTNTGSDGSKLGLNVYSWGTTVDEDSSGSSNVLAYFLREQCWPSKLQNDEPSELQ